MNPVADNTLVVREIDEEKSTGTSDPLHPLPFVRLVTSQRRPMVLRVRTRMEHLRYWRRVPRVPTPMDFDTMPIV